MSTRLVEAARALIAEWNHAPSIDFSDRERELIAATAAEQDQEMCSSDAKVANVSIVDVERVKEVNLDLARQCNAFEESLRTEATSSTDARTRERCSAAIEASWTGLNAHVEELRRSRDANVPHSAEAMCRDPRDGTRHSSHPDWTETTDGIVTCVACGLVANGEYWAKRQESVTTLSEMIEAINERSCVYEIVFRNAGVAICFFEGPPGTPMSCDGAWKKHLVVHKYYPSFEECIRAEHDRLISHNAKEKD